MKKNNWNFWIDKGGTFTDIIALSPEKKLHLKKILSRSDEYNNPIIHGITNILNKYDSQIGNIDSICIGTTSATNALLERTGEKTLLIVSKGYLDSLQIGYQNRDDLFDLHIKKTLPLYSKVIEVDIRLLRNGKPLEKLNWDKIHSQLRSIKSNEYTSICVSLIHGWKYTEYETKLKNLLQDLGHKNITLGHEISETIKYIKRTNTGLINAYVDPIIQSDINAIKQEFQTEKNKINLRFMQSNGGLSNNNNFRGINALLSGPAGGIVGAISSAKASKIDNIITFDMGGTSTDISHFNHEIEYNNDKNINQINIQVPMIDIDTIASGGGSILEYKTSRMTVGPKSAGSYPGPMAYGKGGPLTITDANLILGKILEDHFPKIFGKNNSSPLNKSLVVSAFSNIRDLIDKDKSIEEIAEGYINIAVEMMCRAIKNVSTKKGVNLEDYTLVSYGGAGGQHACLIAENLNIKKILINPLSSFLSAYGIANSNEKYINQKTILCKFTDQNISKIKSIISTLKIENSKNFSTTKISHKPIIYLKYLGTDQTVSLRIDDNKLDIKNIQNRFEKTYKRIYGYIPNTPIIIDLIQVETSTKIAPTNFLKSNKKNSTSHDLTSFFVKGRWVNAEIIHLDSIPNNQNICGPKILIDQNSTIIINDGWVARKDDVNNIILEKNQYAKKQEVNTKSPEILEIFNNLFMSVAETMGETLRRTASSVNIKERLDYSCALFDKHGELVANAPHIPVHLGSMDDCVKYLIRTNSNIKKNDIFISNSPRSGGTHLPDITVISPIFSKENKEIIYFVATRGHHPDVGGIFPGSMSIEARKLEDEGIIFDNLKIKISDINHPTKVIDVLNNSKYPARNPHMNIQDLTAQIAANKVGEIEIFKLIDKYGEHTVNEQMIEIRRNAHLSSLEVIKKLGPSQYTLNLDNFTIQLKIKIDEVKNKIIFDFRGSNAECKNNYNAPIPITKAVIMFVIRCLINDNIPLNSGLLQPVEIILDDDSLLNPSSNAAVSAGNVEISQAIANCIFAAIGNKASCQSTMNNLIFGNSEFQYYETICGGQGAHRDHDGQDAVQTNMTNSRLTDPEIFEESYPISIIELSINKNTGGTGKYIGGDGIKKIFKIEQQMSCSILSNNRIYPPFGLEGGNDGKKGKNTLIRNNKSEELGGNCQIDLHKDDILIIQTPSGGGFGKLN